MNYPVNRTLMPIVPPKIAAFILAGGASRRMGRDKALLPFAGRPLLLHLVNLVAPLAESVVVLGPPLRYEHLCRPLGVPVYDDLSEGIGPLAGIENALNRSASDWNLFLACDMPFVNVDWIQHLIGEARSQPAEVLCVSSALRGEGNIIKPSPLCACWHKHALPHIRQSLATGSRRVQDLLGVLHTRFVFPAEPSLLANWNSPTDVD